MKILIVIIAVIAAFEVVEHVVVPLIWAVVSRKKRSVSGAAGLLGEVAEVRRWKGTEGYVFVKGELWKAAGDGPLSVGDKVLVESVEGLTLKISPLAKT